MIKEIHVGRYMMTMMMMVALCTYQYFCMQLAMREWLNEPYLSAITCQSYVNI